MGPGSRKELTHGLLGWLITYGFCNIPWNAIQRLEIFAMGAGDNMEKEDSMFHMYSTILPP